MSFFIYSILLQSFINLNPIMPRHCVRNLVSPTMQVSEHAGSRTINNATPYTDKNYIDNSLEIQGGSLRTWTYRSPAVEQVQVVLNSDGRPLDADIELWHGPDNTPIKMRVYVENGRLRPFTSIIETPRGPNTIAIRNIGQIEFPIRASAFTENLDSPSYELSLIHI